MKISESKIAYWEEHLSGWAKSGISQKKYCEREGIAYGSFTTWRSRLNQANSPQVPSFIEAATIESERPLSNALVLQISLANGSRIGISAQASSNLIEQVLIIAGRM